MAKNLIDNSKEFLGYYYNTVTDEWIETPKYKFNGKVVSDEVREFIGDFFHLLLDGDMINKYTKIWLKSNLNSMRKCFEAYNNRVNGIERVEIHNIEASIHADKTKLKKYYNSDMLYDVIIYPDTYLETFRSTLDTLQRLYMKDKDYVNALVIKIPKDITTRSITQEQWEKLVEIISTYSKPEIKKLECNSDYREIFGYYNYLISASRLKVDEKNKLAEIRSLLGLEP